jgi:ribose 5-phosphate isomerase B
MQTVRKIAIGCDHGGFAYKDSIIALLQKENIEVIDFGAFSDASVDYPDFGHKVATAIENQEADLGIVLCGSGNGIAMTVNKHQGIRCALCWTAEIAALAKQHNNANVISIPARFVSEALALEMVAAFIRTDFEGGRHAVRVGKIAC